MGLFGWMDLRAVKRGGFKLSVCATFRGETISLAISRGGNRFVVSIGSIEAIGGN